MQQSYNLLMISWIVRALMLLSVIAFMAVGWHVGASVALDVAKDAASQPSGSSPYSVTVSGPKLMEGVGTALSVANAAREARIDADQARVIVLERVDFERSAGGVVARGSVTDLAGPRRLYVVIDAFDENRTYLSSGSSFVDTQASSTSFSVSMGDDDKFASFAVRFLDSGMSEIETRTGAAGKSSLPPLLADDMLHSGDMPEVVERLVSLGYAESSQKVVGDAAALFLVSRFRRDHMLDGPGIVTIGDLLALRTVSPGIPARADLSRY